MKLEELIIDGFKSYATRTVISNWDEQFNCITGLNGSGKSNILDAICFVLGITTMSTVRAQNLQDLIYKRGQAGVTKASVSIVFDNSDGTKSPIGFEACPQISVTRQIVLGGTSKYMINGHRAQQQTVQNLFQSIQLNINNPNFLIMQGRITKVLNMKPTEILAMIEEASGTRMFEERRDKALKTMAKKDKKFDEINELLREEIEPKLDKLRVEKRVFLELQQTQSELERLTKVVVSHDYVTYNELLSNFEQMIAVKTDKMNDVEALVNKTTTEMVIIEEEIARIKALRETELQKGKKYQQLEQELKEFSHEVVRLNTLLELNTKNVAEEEQKGKKIQENISELQVQLEAKTKEFGESQESFHTMKDAYDALCAEAQRTEELLETLQTGVASKEGQKNGFMDQLEEARACASQSKTRQEQIKLQIAHLQKRLKELEPRARQARQQNQNLCDKLERMKSEYQAMQAALSSMNFDPQVHEGMKQQEATSESKIRELTARIDSLNRQVANMHFTYTDPAPNFDRSRVKGLVAQLFSIEKEKYAAATALEICAGGRLYNVVVDTEVTGTQLLERGNLRKRVTIIPLNKIAAFTASAEKIGAAKSIAPGKVDLALTLVGYHEDVSRAMEYVFGSTLICADADTAKRVTFDPRVRLKSVTLQGDLYDPNGTLSGGSAPNSTGVLVTVQELNQLTIERNQEMAALGQLREIMSTEKVKIEEGTELSQQLDLKQHEVALMEQQIANNSCSAIINEMDTAAQTIEQLHGEISRAQVTQGKAENEIRKIEQDMTEFKSNKGSKLEALKKELAALKIQTDKASLKMKAVQKQFQSALLEKDQLENDIAVGSRSFEDTKQSWKDLNAEIANVKEKLESAKHRHTETSQTLEREKAKLIGFDEELATLDDTARAKAQKVADLGLTSQKINHELEKMKSDRRHAHERLSELLSQYSWVEEEKESFGRPGSPYDYSGYNVQECKATMKQLSDRFNEMKKTVNGKVMNMIDNVEKKEVALRTMLKTVAKDKRKIEDTIQSLDKYKKEALINTWQKVNGDFGQIFADMLPGSFAKLEPSEGKDVTEGLEVRVCLGKIWKESLTELSGGQRSLVALSLIMALLQFKPAPMYILDEIDAALDLSHTQNIGRLIKTRFRGSQFIVVSLKEGFFSNANRVFRTRFQEGTSVVSVM
ncbi:RecF/RecN/SMC [Lipomyces tetrasporus]|uniref:Structural maintenance of chromosomes protein n=1 Tax=Lipomyces tetrasporus TaxID=54092 RepID=A0AAD7VW66_9ASCO|nr:RecF/RecN/SMC [Lipomyces tetrasporus]KAJ8103060.1 RecF/RecN/SMC [Lipomyces tetrasporus]